MAPTITPESLLRELVSFDTISGSSTRAILERIGNALGNDVRTTLHTCGQPDDLALIAVAGPELNAARTGLTLSGHVDVVPATEPEWTSRPFTPVVRDNAMYGRGTTDMKGFIALATCAMRAAAAAGTMTHPLALVLTPNEETGSLGMQALAKKLGPATQLPRATIVGEPTRLGVVRMHKGHLKVRYTIAGQAAHSGTPQLGRNAIEPAADLIAALAALRRELEQERNDASPHFHAVPCPVLNVACIRGGSAVNVVPDRCTIDVGLRLLPGMVSDPIVGRLEELAAGDIAMEIINDNPPMLLAEDTELHRVACDITGQSESRGVSFASDGGVMTRDLGMHCVLWGPGDMAVAHKPDEHIELSQLEQAEPMLNRFIHHFCMN